LLGLLRLLRLVPWVLWLLRLLRLLPVPWWLPSGGRLSGPWGWSLGWPSRWSWSVVIVIVVAAGRSATPVPRPLCLYDSTQKEDCQNGEKMDLGRIVSTSRVCLVEPYRRLLEAV
jgi:hypothetical protein